MKSAVYESKAANDYIWHRGGWGSTKQLLDMLHELGMRVDGSTRQVLGMEIYEYTTRMYESRAKRLTGRAR